MNASAGIEPASTNDVSGQARAVLTRIKHFYGPSEAELARYAQHLAVAADASELLLWCERRLESAFRRAGFVTTRPEARRAVVRGHVLVNGRKVIHPGYLVRAGDVLTIRPRSHIEAIYRPRLTSVIQLPGDWLRIEPEALRATVARLPATADVGLRADLAGVLDHLSQ
jgi:small subunit ribosomal protein S4